MKNLFTLFVALFLVVEVYSQNQIPGLDLLGFGYDIQQESPKTALQFPLLSWTYAQGKTYTYPADPQQKVYLVPDQIFVRTLAQTISSSRIYTDVNSLQTNKAIDVGIDFTKSLFQNSTNQTCVTIQTPNPTGGYNNTVNCNTTATSVQKQTFSFGADFNYQSNQIETGNIYITQNTENTELFSLSLNGTSLSNTFMSDIETLTGIPWPGNQVQIQAYFDFLGKYGTHYVSSCTLGGQIDFTSFEQISIDTTSNSIQASASIGSTSTSSTSSILANSAARFTTAVSGQVNIQTAKQVSISQFLSTTDYKLYGGNSNLVNLLDSSQVSNVFIQWRETITSNPVVIRYKLKEIASLFTDEFRVNLEAATKLYIQAVNPTQIVAITPPIDSVQ